MPEHASSPSDGNLQVATLGGGCFWCLEAVFSDLKGVVRVDSGYAGGSRPQPTYQQVCTGATGHAEVVQITFDSAVISYRDLLQVFFSIHDPTTRNRQGADVGTQYRSVIFCHSAEQQRTAAAVMAELTAAGAFSAPIVTELAAFTAFYPAEEYHRDYFRKNAAQPYCQAVISPKLAKFRQRFQPMLRL